MGYQITCKYPEICIQSHENPPRCNDMSTVLQPLLWVRERGWMGSPRLGSCTAPWGISAWIKDLGRWTEGLRPVWQFLSHVLFSEVKILLPLS